MKDEQINDEPPMWLKAVLAIILLPVLCMILSWLLEKMADRFADECQKKGVIIYVNETDNESGFYKGKDIVK